MQDYRLGLVPHRSRDASVHAYRGLAPRLHPSVFLAPGARITGDVAIGANVGLWFNAVVRGDVHTITLGEGTNVQDGALLHCTYKTHPTHVGTWVSIGHLAVLHGCTVQDRALIGMQACVLDGAVIGEGAWVAAGAVVSPGTEIPPRTLARGIPARVVRDLTPEELESQLDTAKRYLLYAAGYDFRT